MSPGVSRGDARLAPAARAARTLCVVLLYYCVSASTILVQKWLMSGARGDAADPHAFPFPLTILTCANVVVSLWALAASRLPRFRAAPLSAEQFRRYVLPIGLLTGVEIGCSNMALLLLTVSFGTIIKGGSPVFTLFWGIVLCVEEFSLPLLAAVAVIVSGITLASLGEGADFKALGFALQVTATALSGLRWAMTHRLLKGNPDNVMPPLTATLYTAPMTGLCVLPVALAFEGRNVAAHMSAYTSSDVLRIALLLFAVATLVFFVLISEYWLVHDTSSLALSVAGVFKECMTIGGGILLFGDTFTPLNLTGFIVCQVGIAAYVVIRYDAHHPPPPRADADDAARVPLAPFRADDDDAWDAGASPLVAAHPTPASLSGSTSPALTARSVASVASVATLSVPRI